MCLASMTNVLTSVKKWTKSADINQNERKDDCDNEDNSMDQIFSNQCDFGSIPSESEMENSRKPCQSKISLNGIQDIIRDVSVVLNRLA